MSKVVQKVSVLKKKDGGIDYIKLLAIADTKTFSQLSMLNSEGTKTYFDVSDDGVGSETIWSGADAEILLIDLLSNFNDKQKIILLYQVLRECGYNIRHEDCAKTLSMSREWYMTLLGRVMKKARKALQNQLK